ncbi:NosD domain-containing protein, partial [Planctomycetota bacterium]
QKACDAAGKAGGGAVILGEGTYHLDQKVLIKHNGVVIRGQGAEKTKLIVRYNKKEDSKGKGIILFTGKDNLSIHALTKDAKRGSSKLVLENSKGIRKGTWIRLHAPATKEWRKLMGGIKTPWDPYRLYMVRAEKINGNEVIVNQPMRIDFPAKDGSKAYRMEPIMNCGVEDFYITQAQKPPKIQTILFSRAVNCWATGIKVDMTGRNPVYATTAKWVTIRDCEFNGSRDCGGGGTGYVGFEKCWDCLMENVRTTNMRHAPNLEWGTSGCVIRNSTFINSDAQCHSGWCHENLFENCVIIRPSGNGSYGHGFYTTSPTDRLHGPIGPRNVIYNCDFTKVPKNGLVLNGMNENWIILYNRFESRGEGILCNSVNFDHIIAHNVFMVRNKSKAVIAMKTKNPSGIEVRSNQCYGGNGRCISGNTKGITASDNTSHSLPAKLPPRPKPEVPSIYEWQQKNASK